MKGYIYRWIVGYLVVFFAPLGCALVDEPAADIDSRGGYIDEAGDEMGADEVFRTRRSVPEGSVTRELALDPQPTVLNQREQVELRKRPPLGCLFSEGCDDNLDPSPSCVPQNGGVEICSGVDEDCDGVVDNIFAGGAVSAAGDLSCASSRHGYLRCMGAGPAAGEWAATPAKFEQLSVGYGHACALGADQNVYCWGDNLYGQAMRSAWQTVEQPNLVELEEPLVKVTAGAQHSCALGSSGRIYCWGRNQHGQLGEGSQRQRVEPVEVVSSRRFVDISAGRDHSCALSQGFEVYCWGKNHRGQGGEAHIDPLLVPTKVDMPLGATQISAGESHTCALAEYGWVYCWGDNRSGQLGDEGTESRARPELAGQEFKLVSLSAGGTRTCGLERNGRIWCWGAVADRGDPAADGELVHPTPRAFMREIDFLSVTAGRSHTCGLDVDGRLFCWGASEHGQLGQAQSTRAQRASRADCS